MIIPYLHPSHFSMRIGMDSAGKFLLCSNMCLDGVVVDMNLRRIFNMHSNFLGDRKISIAGTAYIVSCMMAGYFRQLQDCLVIRDCHMILHVFRSMGGFFVP